MPGWRAGAGTAGGCRFPGSGSRFTDAHHLVHWADGGETRLENLLLLCRGHHRAVHEGRVRVCRGADDSVVFFTAGGRALYDAPRRARGTAGTAWTEEANGTAGTAWTEGTDGTAGTGWTEAATGTAEAGTGTSEAAPAQASAVTADELRLDRPACRNGAARWARDRDVPWGIEVRALDAVEKAAGW